MSMVTLITGHSPENTRLILTWFARQAIEVQVDILRRKEGEHKRLLVKHPRSGSFTLELAALIVATERSGWADEQAYRSSRSIGEDAAKRIQARRLALARQYLSHRDQVRAWLPKHWGKVMDMRRTGLSWRRVARMIEDEHGVRVSHSALFNYWRKWNAEEI